MNDNSLEKLLDEKELAQLIRVSIPTLRYWRSEGKGPRFRKVGQMVRYAPSDVTAWLNSRPTGGESVDSQTREGGVHA
ncbi:MAG: helix-turn-helix domain-containing protein [Acidobacteria bacterium]|nr:helix-turn-helix domain-containing protein [Acidobacteriota bacterium]